MSYINEQVSKEDAQQKEYRPGSYMIVWNRGMETVYVKDTNYFISQGGLTKDWGKRWIEIEADSIEHARYKGHQLRKLLQTGEIT